MRIGVVGGTGPAGRSLSARLADLGHEVVLGSRSAERGEEAATDLRTAWPGRELIITGADNETAAEAELVVLATPWDGASETAGALADRLAGTVVICMANALQKLGREFSPLLLPRGSVAAGVQAAAPRALVAAAMHHLPAQELGQLDGSLDCDVLVCSDHPEATSATLGLMDSLPGVRGVDAGPLSSATAIEAFTAVLVQVNVRYKTRAALRLTGLPG